LTSNLGLCQNIVDDARYFFFTSIDELQSVEMKVSNVQYVMDLLVDRVEGEKKVFRYF
jgi:hypothetical protein